MTGPTRIRKRKVYYILRARDVKIVDDWRQANGKLIYKVMYSTPCDSRTPIPIELYNKWYSFPRAKYVKFNPQDALARFRSEAEAHRAVRTLSTGMSDEEFYEKYGTYEFAVVLTWE